MFMRMIYDEMLAQAAYLIGCQQTGEAIVIDPERDIDRYQRDARANGLRIVAVAETHIHADFVSGAREFAETGAKVFVSDEGGSDWRSEWLDSRTTGGSYRHQRLRDGDTFSIGRIEFRALHTPGHTPEHMVYVVTDRGGGATEPIGVLTGDFLFVGDLGRPDLLESAAGHAGAMEPSARRLFATLNKLGSIPEFVQVWPAHGAGSACGKALGAVPMSTIGYEKRFNPALKAATSESAFVSYILSGQPEPPLYFAAMKRDNKLGPRVLGGVPNTPQATIDELLAVNPAAVAIVDTRPWEQFRAGHVHGSLSLPLIGSFATDAGSLVDGSEEILLVVDPGRLDETVRALIRIGLDRIRGWVPADELNRRSAAGGLAAVKEIDPPEARRLIDAGQAASLDVRRMTEFADGHIAGATNIAHTRIGSRLAEVPTGRPLVVNCRSGVRSARAVSLLKRRGYDAINLRGGILAWQQSQPLAGGS